MQIGWGPFASLYSWDKGVNLIAETYDASERQSGRAENTLSRLTAQLCDLILEQGMDIKTASHMLGHTDAEFTMNTYMHVTDSMVREFCKHNGKFTRRKYGKFINGQ